MAIINEHGSLLDAICACLGRQPETKGQPGPGDLVLCEMHDGEQIAGIALERRLVIRTPRGISDWPIEWARAYWKI